MLTDCIRGGNNNLPSINIKMHKKVMWLLERRKGH